MNTLLRLWLLLSVLALPSGETFFREADAAFNSGNFDEALKLYQRLAVTAEDDTIRSEAWFRSAYTQYNMNKKKDAIASLEHALTLNERIQVDPNIYPPDFAALFDIARLRNKLLELKRPANMEIPKIPLPKLQVNSPFQRIPDLHLPPLSLPSTTPFFLPLEKPPVLLEKKIPTHLPVEGEMVVAVKADKHGIIQDLNVIFSEFPSHDRTLMAYARNKWKIIPGVREGQKVHSLMAYRLTLEAEMKGIRVIRADVSPVLHDEPIPVFLVETFKPEAQELPAGSDFYGPEDLDEPGRVKKVKVNFNNMDTRGTWSGIALVNGSGKISQFRATDATLPAAAASLATAMKNWTFQPAVMDGHASQAYLNIDIELLYTLTDPHLKSYELLDVTLLPR